MENSRKLSEPNNNRHISVMIMPSSAGRCAARVGFIGQGENQVGFQLPCTFKRLQHGKPVKKMAGIYHDRHKKGGEGRKGGGHDADRHKLHGTGVDTDAHQKCPQRRKALARPVTAAAPPKPNDIEAAPCLGSSKRLPYKFVTLVNKNLFCVRINIGRK